MRALVLAIGMSLAGTAHAEQRAGIRMPDSINIAGSTLVLNGMGIRQATIFRVNVYVAGLYLQRKSHDGREVIRSHQLKRLDVVLLRDVDRADLIDAWLKGLKANGADMIKLKHAFEQFARLMTDMKKGDNLKFTYVPADGLSVIVRGEAKGTVRGSEFAAALFAIWLGAHPADEGLKNQLLGNQ